MGILRERAVLAARIKSSQPGWQEATRRDGGGMFRMPRCWPGLRRHTKVAKEFTDQSVSGRRRWGRQLEARGERGSRSGGELSERSRAGEKKRRCTGSNPQPHSSARAEKIDLGFEFDKGADRGPRGERQSRKYSWGRSG